MNLAARQLRGISELKEIPAMIFKAIFKFDFI